VLSNSALIPEAFRRIPKADRGRPPLPSVQALTPCKRAIRTNNPRSHRRRDNVAVDRTAAWPFR